MGSIVVGDVRLSDRGDWLLGWVVTTGSLVLRRVGGTAPGRFRPIVFWTMSGFARRLGGAREVIAVSDREPKGREGTQAWRDVVEPSRSE